MQSTRAQRSEYHSEPQQTHGPWADAENRLPLMLSIFILGAPLWGFILLVVLTLMNILN